MSTGRGDESNRFRLLARRRILAGLDEVVAQCTAQAGLFEQRDAAAPLLLTDEVARWVRNLSLALSRYAEGEYEAAAALADITGIDEPSVLLQTA